MHRGYAREQEEQRRSPEREPVDPATKLAGCPAGTTQTACLENIIDLPLRRGALLGNAGRGLRHLEGHLGRG